MLVPSPSLQTIARNVGRDSGRVDIVVMIPVYLCLGVRRQIRRGVQRMVGLKYCVLRFVTTRISTGFVLLCTDGRADVCNCAERVMPNFEGKGVRQDQSAI